MIKKILLHPLAVLVAMILGCVCGTYFPQFSKELTPITATYSALLHLCSLPIIICLVIRSIGRIFKEDFKRFFMRFMIAAFASMFLASFVGLGVAGISSKYMEPNDVERVALSKLSEKPEAHVYDQFVTLKLFDANAKVVDQGFGITNYIKELFTDNIFRSLSENTTLQIIIFFIIFGLMLNFIDKKYSEPLLNAVEGIYKAMMKFTIAILIFLPFFMFAQTAELVCDMNLRMLLGLIFKFILILYVAMIVYIAILWVYVGRKKKLSFMTQLKGMKNAFLVSLISTSKGAAFPYAEESAKNAFGIDEDAVNITMPVSTTLFPSGKTMIAALISVYAISVYKIDVKPWMIVFLIFSVWFMDWHQPVRIRRHCQLYF